MNAKTAKPAAPRLSTAAFGEKDWDCTPADLLNDDIVITDAVTVEKTFKGEKKTGYMLTVRLANKSVTRCLVTNIVLVRTIDQFLLTTSGEWPKAGLATKIVQPKGQKYYVFE